MRTICFTGPESTGKTTLAARCAELLGAEVVPEGSRVFVETVTSELTVATVLPIAELECALIDDATKRAVANGKDTLVLDTDLLSTVVYGEHYYGFRSAWIVAEARRRLADLYFLCDVDVPWIADGVRDQPEARDVLHAEFVAVLYRFEARVVLLRGSWDQRWEQVRSALGFR